jgi:hypothetical protein
MRKGTDWAWCYENPKDAASLIDALEAERDALRAAANPACPCPDSCHAVQRCYGGCLAKQKD